MKKQERTVYLELSGLVGATLCCWCCYGEFQGYSLCADDGYYECRHGLSDRSGFPWNEEPAEAGDDCWGFNSQWNLATISDIIGIILENGWEQKDYHWGFQWDPKDKSDIKVAGIKASPMA